MKGFILAFLGSVFPAVLFNIEKKNLFFAGLSGGIGYSVYLVFYNNNKSVILATFCGSIAIGLYSEIMARIKKTPRSVFSISGIFPLVPGLTAYYTIRNIVEKNYSVAAGKGVETIAVAGAIAFGIMISSAAFRFVIALKNKCKIKKLS